MKLLVKNSIIPQNLARFSTKFIYLVGTPSANPSATPEQYENVNQSEVKSIQDAVKNLQEKPEDADAKQVLDSFIKAKLDKSSHDKDLLKLFRQALKESDDVTDPLEIHEIDAAVKRVKENLRVGDAIGATITGPEELSGSLEVGTEIPIKFATKALERGVGMSDILDKTVAKVEVFDEMGQSLGIATRDSLKGGFHYADGGYAKIINNYKVKIKELRTDEQIQKLQKNFKKEDLGDIDLAEEEAKTILAVAEEYNIDPKFLAALRKTENGGAGKEMGILGYETKNFRDQVRLAARTIQNNEKRFSKVFNNKPVVKVGGKYTAEFLVAFSSRYAPEGVANDPGNLNSNHVKNLARFYGIDLGKVDVNAMKGVLNNLRTAPLPASVQKQLEKQINLGEKLNREEALNLLGSGFTVKSTSGDLINRSNRNATTLEGLRRRTALGMKALQQKLGLHLIITGGTETGHAGGLTGEGLTHGNGYKVDISLKNGVEAKVMKLIETNGGKLSYVSGYGQKYKIKLDGYTYHIIKEADHFDIAVL